MKPSQLLALFEGYLKPGSIVSICLPMPKATEPGLHPATVRIDNLRADGATIEECAVKLAEQITFVPVRKEAA